MLREKKDELSYEIILSERLKLLKVMALTS